MISFCKIKSYYYYHYWDLINLVPTLLFRHWSAGVPKPSGNILDRFTSVPERIVEIEKRFLRPSGLKGLRHISLSTCHVYIRGSLNHGRTNTAHLFRKQSESSLCRKIDCEDLLLGTHLERVRM